MTRLYGRTPSGRRLAEAVLFGHWNTITSIGALRSDGMIAPGLFDGTINGNMFVAYVEQVGASSEYM
jgi:hypothetical protein